MGPLGILFSIKMLIHSLLDFVINTGVSRIESLCLRGTKNLFLPISNENVFVSMLGSTSNNDTDSNKLKLFEPVSVLSLDSLTSKSFIGTKNRLLNSLGTRKNDLRKVISSSNYVSELWITRDNQNNNRLLFAIDLASYLSENSSHPFLYDKEELSEAMKIFLYQTHTNKPEKKAMTFLIM